MLTPEGCSETQELRGMGKFLKGRGDPKKGGMQLVRVFFLAEVWQMY